MANEACCAPLAARRVNKKGNRALPAKRATSNPLGTTGGLLIVQPVTLAAYFNGVTYSRAPRRGERREHPCMLPVEAIYTSRLIF